jgi:hypothetical protein
LKNKKNKNKMRTREEIKEEIIELNFDLLRFFDDKEKVREIRDKIQLLLIEYLS